MKIGFLIVCLLCLICCQGQINNYIIIKNYHGWLVVRELPNSLPGPKTMYYEFDKNGFCITRLKISGWAQYRFWYRDINGDTLLPHIVDEMPKNTNMICVWTMETHGRATSEKYKGEYWHTFFVGTSGEYRSAINNNLEYFDKYKLYAVECYHYDSPMP